MRKERKGGLNASLVLVKYMSSYPSRLQSIFWTATTPSSNDHVIHPSWYWCFKAIIHTGDKVRTIPIRDPVKVLFEPSLASKYAEFTRPATYVPSWAHAQDMGGGSSTPLGNLGNFTEVYPVEAEHVITLFNELVNPTM